MTANLDSTKEELLHLSAQSVADYFLSPFVEKKLFLELTAEEGPTLWIVNRSDVYDETLDLLSEHPLPGIRERAQEKRALRSGLKLKMLPEAKSFEIPAAKLPQDDVEEILGHPLAPFEAMLFFASDMVEDSRASACLSLTRRVLEHPPVWLGFDATKTELQRKFFEVLVNDPSAFVRSFASRIPLFEEDQIIKALETETHPFIIGRLMQNPGFKDRAWETFLKRVFSDSAFQSDFLTLPEWEFPRVVLALDRRLKEFEVKKLLNLVQTDSVPKLSKSILSLRLV
jgi:hypothetical protein